MFTAHPGKPVTQLAVEAINKFWFVGKAIKADKNTWSFFSIPEINAPKPFIELLKMNTNNVRFSSITLVIAAFFAATLHVFTAFWYLDHPALYDEMYHAIAARSLFEIGEPVILDGQYTRGLAYTWLIAGVQSICGESLYCARVSSLVTTTFLVFLLTAFTGKLFGVTAGLIAGVLLATAPPIVGISQFVRFYALHALVVSIAAYHLYMALEESQRLRIFTRGIIAGGLFLFAYHLQALTLLLSAALIVAVMVSSSDRWLIWVRRQSSITWAVIAVVFLGFTIWLLNSNLLHFFSRNVFSGPLWSAGLADNWLYYHHSFKKWYPTLWPLTPFLTLVAFIKRPRVVTYCIVTFTIIFFILSIAWTKGDRYIAFALPFLFVPLSIGIAVSLRQLVIGLENLFNEFAWILPLRRVSFTAAIFVVSAAVFSYLSFQPLTRTIVAMASGGDHVRFYGNYYGQLTEWRPFTEQIRDLALDHPVVVTSSGVSLAAYLGDFSYDLHASTLGDIGGGEFSVDYRTGRSVISQPESLRKIVNACGPGMAVIEKQYAGEALKVPEDVMTELEAIGRPIHLDNSNILIWIWDGQPFDTTPPPGGCRKVLTERLLHKNNNLY